jgi:hypothetical protein
LPAPAFLCKTAAKYSLTSKNSFPILHLSKSNILSIQLSAGAEYPYLIGNLGADVLARLFQGTVLFIVQIKNDFSLD